MTPSAQVELFELIPGGAKTSSPREPCPSRTILIAVILLILEIVCYPAIVTGTSELVLVRWWCWYGGGGGGGSVSQSCPTLVTPWTIACQAPLSMEFSRQE